MSDYTKLLLKIRLENQLQPHKQYQERYENTRRRERNVKNHNYLLEWHRLRAATSQMSPALQKAYAQRMNTLHATIMSMKPDLNRGPLKFQNPVRIT